MGRKVRWDRTLLGITIHCQTVYALSKRKEQSENLKQCGSTIPSTSKVSRSLMNSLGWTACLWNYTVP